MTSLIPLKYVAELNPETLRDDTDPGKPFRYIDIAATGRGRLVSEPMPMTFGASPSRARRVIRPGDTILSTVRTYLRAVWTHRNDDDDLVASTGFVCLRPRAGIDPRFLGWVAQSDTVVEEVVARSVGVSYPAVSPSDVGTIGVIVPPVEKQRAVADYLDHEVGRIEALITAKHRMISLLDERWHGLVSELTRAIAAVQGDSSLPAGWRVLSLRRCLKSSDYGIGESSSPTGRGRWWGPQAAMWTR